MVTLKDVANIAGVSASTVSRVVCGKDVVKASVKLRVEQAIKETGYRPNQNARALVNKRSNTIGLIIPDLSLSFYGKLASGVIKAANKKGYKTLISNSLRDSAAELSAITSFKEQGCHNLILHSVSLSDDKLRLLCEENPNLVIVNRLISGLNERCVFLDNTLGGMLAAKTLVDHGHKKLVVLASENKINDAYERVAGVKKGLKEAGVSLENEAVFYAEPSLIGGKKAINAALSNGLSFTAVIAYNDNMAVGAMNELLDQGYQVPHDISVIGFDDLFFASTCRPALTTFFHPIEGMGEYATHLSLALPRLDISTELKTRAFKPSLVMRNSVSKI